MPPIEPEGDASPPLRPAGRANDGRSFPARSVVATTAIAVLLATVFQLIAPRWDHQLANIATAAVVLLACLWLLVLLQRYQMSRGRPWRLPLVTGLVVLTLAALLRFDGFSGEMVPQLRFRFAARPQPLQATPVDASRLAEIDLALPRSVASTDSPQFLGPDRDGSIERREFAIPGSVDQVTTLWRVPVGEGWSAFAVSGDRAVTLEQRGDQECVTCYRLADGELLWIHSHPARHENAMGGIGPRSTPTIRAGRVYAQGATAWLGCLDLASGELIWSQDLLQLAGWNQTASEVAAPWGRATSPLLVDQLCVVGFGGPLGKLPEGINGRSLIAVAADSGEIAWTAGEDQLSYASPNLMSIDSRQQIVSVNEASITGHAIASGDVLWSFPWYGETNGGPNCSMIIPVKENQFLIGKGYSGGSALVAVRPSGDGKLEAEAIWAEPRVLQTKFTHAVVTDATAYGLSDGWLQAVRLSDGEELWRQPRRSRAGQGQVLLVEDVLVVQTEPGPISFVEANRSEYRELFELEALDARTWNVPTVAGRHLLVRNDHEAVCYFLPERSDK